MQKFFKWFDKMFHWVMMTPEQRQDHFYLSQATDIADLENRMKRLQNVRQWGGFRP